MMTRRKTRRSIGLNQSSSSVPNDELLHFEILPRLPSRTLCKFKSVCKEWCTFISSDPSFMAAHLLHQSLTTPQTFVYQKKLHEHNHFDDEYEEEEEEEEENGERKREITIRRAEKLLTLSSSSSSEHSFPDSSLSYIAGNLLKVLKASTNGLLCGLQYEKEPLCERVYITNPITKRWISIPLWTTTPLTYIGFPGLAFDPFNHLSHYVLVFPCACNELGIGGVRFKVYSSLAGRWRDSKAKIDDTVNGLSKETESTYSNGKLYWSLFTTKLIWFDVKNETAGILNGPPCPFGDQKWFEIGDCNGELSYSRFVKEESNIEIWIRRKKKADEFEWVKVRCLSLSKMFNENADTLSYRSYGGMKLRRRDKMNILSLDYYKAKPLCYEGGDIVWFWAKYGLKKEDVGNVFAYDMKTGVLRKMQKLEKKVVFLSYKSCLVELPSNVLQID